MISPLADWHMSLFVALAVLVSALLHASWNAVIRFQGDRVAAVTLLAGCGAALAFPALFFVSPPPPAARGWLAASVLLHLGYNVFLANAYRFGELGKVYPIARGGAPLLTLLAGFFIVGERLEPLAIAGVVTLGAGILSLTLDNGLRALRAAPQSAILALCTAVFISAYTIADGMGARVAGDPHGYAMWLFFLNGLPLVLYALWSRGGRATVRMARANAVSGLLAGGMSLGAYWIVIWAMSTAPIALVAALRETSVIFAVLIGIVFLGERLTLARVWAVAVVAAGLVLLRV